MAARINELRQRRIAARASFQALLDKHLSAAAAENRGFSPEDKVAQAEAKLVVENLDELIAAEELRLEGEKAAAVASPSIRVGAPNVAEDPRKGFRSHREFLLAAIDNSGFRDRGQVHDERLKVLAVAGDKEDRVAAGELAFMLPEAFTPPSLLGTPAYQATVGSDEQGVYDDRYGGFAVPRTLLPGVLALGFEGDPSSGRTQSVPMATPAVDMLARTDKNHTTSVSGGFTVARRAETVAAVASRSTMEMVSLKAASVFGLGYATEEILSDSAISFVAVIEAGFRDQFGHYMFSEKLRGLGGDQYLGILTALAASSLGPTISIAKEGGQAAATVVYQNAIKMRARCWGYGNAIWMANHDTYPQLAVLAVPIGVGGQLVYQQSLVEDRPDMLLGRPIYYSEYPSTLGTQGDLILGNWSQFLEGVYQPLQSAESIHVRFVNHERTFKFWLRNAGAPWWKTALTPHKGANTLSPFVVLDTRA